MVAELPAQKHSQQLSPILAGRLQQQNEPQQSICQPEIQTMLITSELWIACNDLEWISGKLAI